jgi:hypothetical protein
MNASTAVAVESTVTEELIALERRINDAWVKGDPDDNLAVLSDEISYFDSGQHRRLDGAESVRANYEANRGKSSMDSYEMSGCRVQLHGSVAILTYRIVTRKGAEAIPFHGTQVYEREEESGWWRLIHSHFSRAKQA